MSALLAEPRSEATAPPPLTGNVFIVVPAYQEEQMLGQVLDELLPLGAEIVVVDDGSGDATAEVARGFPVHLLCHAINLGQGAALQTGIEYALAQGARVVVTFDADGQHRAADILRLCAPVLHGEADACLGSRFLRPEHAAQVPLLRRWLLKLGTWFTRHTTGLPVTDTHNGLRALARRCAEQIHIAQPRMAHASEILAQLGKLGLRVVEVPVEIAYTHYSLAKGQSLFNSVNVLLALLLG